MFDNISGLIMTAFLILPGYIISCVIRKVMPMSKKDKFYYVLECFLYSLLFLIFAYLPIKFFNEKINNKSLFWFVMLFFIFVASIVLGLLLAHIYQQRIFDRILRFFGLKTIISIPSSWDYFFSKQEPYFVILTLRDGAKIYGYYGENSYSSSSIDERDLYIERIFKNEKWEEDIYSAGFYVNKDNIQYIEFKVGGNNNEFKKGKN